MKNTDPSELLTYGLHLGHKKNKIHPKSKRYIHSIEKGVSIIDLFQTADLLDKAKAYVETLGKENKSLVVVASKRGAREVVTEICKEHNVPYMTNKWVGGFFTNFDQVLKNIEKMNTMREEETTGGWDSMPKHERVYQHKKLHRIETIYAGVSSLKALPDAVFVVDIRKEHNAVVEATQRDISTVAIVDTNVNPEVITYPIPANDDAVLSIKYIAESIIKTYADAKAKAKDKAEKVTSDDTKKK
jgi:small subunit ribosomal protein S2